MGKKSRKVPAKLVDDRLPIIQSDFHTVVGRQIAMNRALVCFAEPTGNIIAFNKSLENHYSIKGHTEMVLDMVFFDNKDVHLLASASVDRRFYVWEVLEGPEEQISTNVVLALHIEVKDKVTHPCVCWHTEKQEILAITIGRHVLVIDTTKTRGVKSAEKPMHVPIHGVIKGVRNIGKHDAEVTDLSMSKHMHTCLVSASKDGKVKIWEYQKSRQNPIFVLTPYNGHPVYSATFLAAPQWPENIILITVGPLKLVKYWASDSEEGRLLPRNLESLHCFEENIVGEISNVKKACMCRFLVFPEASIILFANAMETPLYAMHIEFGATPEETSFKHSYFPIKVPILSLTGEFEILPSGEKYLELYCLTPSSKPVQRLRINLHPSEALSATLGLKSTIQDSASTSTSTEASNVNTGTDMNLSLSDPIGDQSVIECTVDTQMDNIHPSFSDKTDDDSRNDVTKVSQDDVHNSPVIIKHPTHLITPDILMAHSETTNAISGKSEGDGNILDVTVNGDTVNPEVEVEVVGEAGSAQNSQSISRASPITTVTENSGMMFSSQNSDLGSEMSRECCAKSEETYILDDAREVDVANMTESLDNNGNGSESEVYGSTKGVSGEPGASSSLPFVEAVLPKILAMQQDMQESINEIKSNLKEMQVEKAVKANTDALWARFQEENVKNEKLARNRTQETTSSIIDFMNKDLLVMLKKMIKIEVAAVGAVTHLITPAVEKSISSSIAKSFQEENAKNEKLARGHRQQISNFITNFMNKDLPLMLEKTLKKEVAAVGPAVAHLITPLVEKSISSAVVESFQREVGDKAMNRLERSVTTILEAQFPSSGNQALQDAWKSCLEASVIPAFEKGMAEHTNAAKQHFESTHSELALALRDAINSASSLTQTLSGELADGQRKMLALAAAGADAKVEVPVDPIKELSRLITEFKYEEAFTAALQRNDVHIVSWLCSQVNLPIFLSKLVPCPLSQGVLLNLLQQLSWSIHKDTPIKLAWMTDVCLVINPPIAENVRPILEQVRQILTQRLDFPMFTTFELRSIRLVDHIINSLLTSCN